MLAAQQAEKPKALLEFRAGVLDLKGNSSTAAHVAINRLHLE